jgi:hypothetical protein
MNAPRDLAIKIEALAHAMAESETYQQEKIEQLAADASEAARAYIASQSGI